MYVLDADACIDLLNGASPHLARRLRRRVPSEIRLCSVVKAELVYGARKSRRPAENLRLLDRFFEPFASLPFDDSCAGPYGQIRADLERTGERIGANDLLIAATAVAHDAVLVTGNVDEFSRVQGLRIEDWTSA